MGEVRLLNVVTENFLTIRSASLNFENRGLVLVEGPNGAGKSALVVEPLCYALFGESERYGKSRDQVINRFVGRDCHVGVELNVDGLDVRIEAFRKHRKFKDQVSGLMMGGDDVFLFINGEDRRGNSNDQTWNRIIKILDMDYTAFTNSVVFGQALSQYFSGLSDAAQKEIVERLLGITWIPDAYEVAKKDSNNCLSILSLTESECKVLSDDLEKLKRELTEYKRKYDEFEEEKKRKIKELESSLESEADTSKLEEDVRKSKYNKELVEEDLYRVDKEIQVIDKEGVRLETEIKGFERDIRRIESLLSQISFAEIGSICEFCGRRIDADTAKHYKEHLGKDKAKVGKVLSSISASLFEVESKSKDLETIKSKLELKLKGLDIGLRNLESELEGIRLRNAGIEERNKQIEIKIKDITGSVNIYSELVEKFEREIGRKEDNYAGVGKRIEELRLELKYHRFWEEGFSNRGLKSFIIESTTPQMNQFAQLYSSALGGKFDISFSAQKALKKGELREKFYVNVLNKTGSQCYEGNSNGERRAIDSIVMFVLGDLVASRSNKRFSVLILDDVFEKLDEEICDSIIRVLRTMTSSDTEGLPRRESIFVLTHLEYFKSKFENRISVERGHGSETVYREN